MSFWIRSLLSFSEPKRKAWFWIDCKIPFTFLWRNTRNSETQVSDSFSALTKTLWKKFVQTEYNSCKKFAKDTALLQKFCKKTPLLHNFCKIQTYLARFCKSLSLLMHSLARSCRSFCNNFVRVAFFLN